MNAALAVAGYAVVVACCAPAPLTLLTHRGISARIGLTTWLAVMACVLAAGAVALQFLLRAAIDGWPRLSEVVCRSVVGGACTPVVYRSALFELALALVSVTAVGSACGFGWRCGRRVRRSGQRSRAHAQAARITGRELPGTGAVVLDAMRPVAYCVAGRPGAIVLSSGVLALLDHDQIGAVLAHERAHLSGRHHLLIALTRALPGLPLFRHSRKAVARLSEMCADDAAARRAGRGPLLAALLAMSAAGDPEAGVAGGGPAADTALAATGYVADRIARLLEPPGRGSRLCHGAGLIAVMMLLAAALAALTLAAGISL